MAEIWIWNSMAARRRSASDTFEENGVQIIKSYLAAQNHHVTVFDWATDSGFESLSPFVLRKLNRYLFEKVLQSKSASFRAIFSFLSMVCQQWLTKSQNRRMKSRLTSLAKQVKKNDIRFFGIKVWYGEAFTWAKFLTRAIQKYSPETVVISGGYHSTLYEEDILRNSTFDLAVIDEGEYILEELLNFGDKLTLTPWTKTGYLNSLLDYLQKQPLYGLIYRWGAEVIKIPREACESEILRKKSLPRYKTDSGKVKVHILMESLGCPWNKCNFCVHNQFAPVYKIRKIDDIIDEIKNMTSQGIGLFRFTGSDTPPQFGRSIARAILDQNIKIEFAMGSRALPNAKSEKIYNEIRDSFEVMIKAGLRGVFIGGETGNDYINETVMNKGLTAEDIIYTIKAIRDAEKNAGEKITVSLALIYPTPLFNGISNDDIVKDNIYLLKESMPDAVMISPPGPFKNSVWYNEKERFGFELDENFVPEFMEYEYVLYKPLTMWPEMKIKVQGKTFKEILAESQRFRRIVEGELGILTDLSDEHFLMIRSADLFSEKGIKEFKNRSMVSIVSCDYSYLNEISRKVTAYSNKLAMQNLQ